MGNNIQIQYSQSFDISINVSSISKLHTILTTNIRRFIFISNIQIYFIPLLLSVSLIQNLQIMIITQYQLIIPIFQCQIIIIRMGEQSPVFVWLPIFKCSQTYLHSHDQLPQIHEITHQKLSYKYDQQFNIFRKIPINYIVYNYTKSSHTLDYRDAVSQSIEHEYLEKIYENGENNIQTCINFTEKKLKSLISTCRLIREYLTSVNNSSTKISYEYPTMFLTETHQIFLTRLRRRMWGKAIDVSSSMTMSQSSKYKVKYMHGESSSISNKYLEQSSVRQQSDDADYTSEYIERNSIEYGKSVHNIYDIISISSSIINPENKIVLRDLREESFDQLIYDFQKQPQPIKCNEEADTSRQIHVVGSFSDFPISMLASKNPHFSAQQEKLNKIFERQELRKQKTAQQKIKKNQVNSKQRINKPIKKGKVHEKARELLEKIINKEQSFYEPKRQRS